MESSTGRHAVAREKGRRGARFAGTARRRAGPARDFDRTIPRKGRDIAARANVRGIDAGQTPSRRRLSAPPKGRHSFARVVVRDCETHHSRLDAPALRLAGVCAFMFGSSARSLRQVLPPENIMSYRVSIGLLRRRLLLRPDAHLSANKGGVHRPKSDLTNLLGARIVNWGFANFAFVWATRHGIARISRPQSTPANNKIW